MNFLLLNKIFFLLNQDPVSFQFNIGYMGKYLVLAVLDPFKLEVELIIVGSFVAICKIIVSAVAIIEFDYFTNHIIYSK